MENTKGNVILAPGPLHIFWTGGVYYLWELSKKYNVILIVDEAYKESVDFKKVTEITGVLEILYMPSRGIIKKHLYYANEFKRAVEEYRPRIIFHHDSVYSSMMYLYHWGSRISPPSLRICVLFSKGEYCNFAQECKNLVDNAVATIANKYRLPKSLCRLLFTAKNWLLFYLDYYILPLLFIRKSFSPQMNPFTLNILKNFEKNQFDFYLLYDDSDKKLISRMFGSDNGIRKVRHPLNVVGDELHKILYGSKEENIVLILPSYGHLDAFQKKNKKSNSQLIDDVSLKWIEAIKAMKMKFINYKFNWKLHPAQTHDYLWQAITDKVKQECPEVIILSADENAQKLILKSKVIVGEITAALWWSSFFAEKITISFDIFGIPGMDFFKTYEGAYYFNDLKCFSETDFMNRDICPVRSRGSLPALSDFLNSTMAPKG